MEPGRTAAEQAAQACLAPAEPVLASRQAVEPARFEVGGTASDVATSPAAGAAQRQIGIADIARELVAVEVAIDLLKFEASEVGLDFLRVAGPTILKHPLDFGAGAGAGFGGALVDTVWQPLKMLGVATVWLAKGAACTPENALNEWFMLESGTQLFSGDACEPYNELALELRDAYDTLIAMFEQEYAALISSPELWVSEMLDGVLVTLQLLGLLMLGPARQTILARANDARALGKLVGAVLFQVALTAATATLGNLLKVSAASAAVEASVDAAVIDVAEVSDAIAASRAATAGEDGEAITAAVDAATKDLATVIRRRPVVNSARLAAARRILQPLLVMAKTIDDLTRAWAQSLFLKVGIFADLDAEKAEYNAQALLASLVKYMQAGGLMSRPEELRATAALTEEVFENAHIVDKRFYESFRAAFEAIGLKGGTDRMRSFLVPASDHTRSVLAYFERILGWRPEPADVGGLTDSITQVFLKKIVFEKAGVKAPANAVLVVTKGTRLSEVYEAHATVWKTYFPAYYKAIAATLDADISALKTLGL